MAKNRTSKNGTVVSDKMDQNFIEGTGITLTITDSANRANIQIDNSGAPSTADYLVGTANSGLSAEIAVGTTPGGELGGTWASPTVDATHSNSAHLRDYALPTGGLFSTFPRWPRIGNSGVLSSQRLQLNGIVLPAGTVVTSITFVSGTQALVGGNHQIFGIYDSSRNLLATSTDDTSTAWAANSAKTLSLTPSTYTVLTTGFYYLALLVDAGTVPSMMVSDWNSNVVGALSPVLSGSSTTAQTSLPSSGAAMLQNNTCFAYVS